HDAFGAAHVAGLAAHRPHAHLPNGGPRGPRDAAHGPPAARPERGRRVRRIGHLPGRNGHAPPPRFLFQLLIPHPDSGAAAGPGHSAGAAKVAAHRGAAAGLGLAHPVCHWGGAIGGGALPAP
nr:hypothetical protein [Tanacetum cinerariifolium]